MDDVLAEAEQSLKNCISKLDKLPIDAALAEKEPSDLNIIKSLRPESANREMWTKFDKKLYKEKLEGAFLGRCAGNALGAMVEFWPIEKMKKLAADNCEPFPPVDYWKYIPSTEMKPFRRKTMSGVPHDDDIAYTLLGLLILEGFGIDFTTADVGKAWVKYLPVAYTAEEVALKNLKNNIPAEKAADIDNPYCELIGADIRSDPWGYVAPGLPAKAAELAYRDAYLSHRRQGIYGEMFFAAAIAAAFAVEDPIEALLIGLREIPAECSLAKAANWALEISSQINNYQDARNAMDEKFKGMHHVHTNNNACLTIWGITIGKTDFSKVISETVAMGMDNDCTAATAGSIVGAIIGKSGIPKKWYKPFNNKVHTNLINNELFSIKDIINRFTKQAEAHFNGRQ